MTNPTSTPKIDAQTFGSIMGQVVWPITMSPSHRDLPTREIATRVSSPLLLRQFKLYSKCDQPVAFIAWALVTDAAKARLDADDGALDLTAWRGGENLVIVDCVSPSRPSRPSHNSSSAPPQRSRAKRPMRERLSCILKFTALTFWKICIQRSGTKPRLPTRSLPNTRS